MMKFVRRAAFGLAALALCALPAAAQFFQNTITSVGGSGTAYTGTLNNATSLASIANVQLLFVPNTGSTGAATLQLNGVSGNIGLKPLRKPTSAGLSPLANGDLVAGQGVMLFYDATNDTFDLTNPPPTGAASGLPQGYLTPCQVTNGSPVTGCTAGQLLPSGDVTAATVLYYEPAFGSTVPIYNGSAFITFQFSELTLTIPSSRLANTIYDVLIFNNAGVVTPCFSVAWTTSTAGSGTRGTGAGTAQISQVNGIWTNAVAVTGCVNGASSFNISANQGTYVATCLVDGTNGQMSFNPAWGSSRRWACWNAYNKQTIRLQGGDSTSSWSYTSTVIRQANGGAGNTLFVVTGLPTEMVDTSYTDYIVATWSNGGHNSGAILGIGVNSTTAFSGTQAQDYGSASTTSVNSSQMATGYFTLNRPLGLNDINALEQGAPSIDTFTGHGTQSNMLLTASWRG